MQGAIEVWEYSMRQIGMFKESQLDSQGQIKFRHVPFSWFPVVRITAVLPFIRAFGLGTKSKMCMGPQPFRRMHTWKLTTRRCRKHNTTCQLTCSASHT